MTPVWKLTQVVVSDIFYFHPGENLVVDLDVFIYLWLLTMGSIAIFHHCFRGIRFLYFFQEHIPWKLMVGRWNFLLKVSPFSGEKLVHFFLEGSVICSPNITGFLFCLGSSRVFWAAPIVMSKMTKWAAWMINVCLLNDEQMNNKVGVEHHPAMGYLMIFIL